MTWGCFVKNSLFDSLFLMNLSVFPWDFSVFLKIYHSVKIGVWNDSQTMWDSFSINAENLPYLCFWNLLCMRKIVPTCACKKLCAHTDSCVRIARVSLALLFQKYIYLLIKSYIFHFNISQVNLTSDWALNQPWVLEFSIIWEWGLEL